MGEFCWGKLGPILSLFPNKTRRLRHRARDTQESKVTQKRW